MSKLKELTLEDRKLRYQGNEFSSIQMIPPIAVKLDSNGDLPANFNPPFGGYFLVGEKMSTGGNDYLPMQGFRFKGEGKIKYGEAPGETHLPLIELDLLANPPYICSVGGRGYPQIPLNRDDSNGISYAPFTNFDLELPTAVKHTIDGLDQKLAQKNEKIIDPFPHYTPETLGGNFSQNPDLIWARVFYSNIGGGEQFLDKEDLSYDALSVGIPVLLGNNEVLIPQTRLSNIINRLQ